MENQTHQRQHKYCPHSVTYEQKHLEKLCYSNKKQTEKNYHKTTYYSFILFFISTLFYLNFSMGSGYWIQEERTNNSTNKNKIIKHHLYLFMLSCILVFRRKFLVTFLVLWEHFSRMFNKTRDRKWS